MTTVGASRARTAPRKLGQNRVRARIVVQSTSRPSAGTPGGGGREGLAMRGRARIEEEQPALAQLGHQRVHGCSVGGEPRAHVIVDADCDRDPLQRRPQRRPQLVGGGAQAEISNT